LLAVGLVSAAVLALGGGALALLQPGWRDGRLTARGREIFAALGRGLLEGSLPAADPPRRRAIDALLARIDALVVALPPHAQGELAQLLAIMGAAGGRALLVPLEADWSGASVAEVQQALARMRFSSLALRRQAYQALHDIVGSAFFADPSTWNALGYPGPLKI
jgi:hypothetical protein